MALAIKAIVHNATGTRYEGEDLSEYLLDYAKNNREQFSMIYAGDIVEGPDGVHMDEGAETVERYTATSLRSMNKDGIFAVLKQRGIEVEGNVSKDDLIDMVLESQKA